MPFSSIETRRMSFPFRASESGRLTPAFAPPKSVRSLSPAFALTVNSLPVFPITGSADFCASVRAAFSLMLMVMVSPVAAVSAVSASCAKRICVRSVFKRRSALLSFAIEARLSFGIAMSVQLVSPDFTVMVTRSDLFASACFASSFAISFDTFARILETASPCSFFAGCALPPSIVVLVTVVTSPEVVSFTVITSTEDGIGPMAPPPPPPPVFPPLVPLPAAFSTASSFASTELPAQSRSALSSSVIALRIAATSALT